MGFYDNTMCIYHYIHTLERDTALSGQRETMASVKPSTWSNVSEGVLNLRVHLGLSLPVHVVIADALAKVFFVQLFLFGLDDLLNVLQLLLQLPFLFA